MSTNSIHRIKPAGRHIFTIGRDLIQNKNAAIVELVKNAYDADSEIVEVSIKKSHNNTQLKISDCGEGMSSQTIIDKWLVPSNSSKSDDRTTPSGRIMQGRKGVGRYAAAILGVDLLLETRQNGIKSKCYLVWDSFTDARFLEDVEIRITSDQTDEPNGTTLTINTEAKAEYDWTDSDAVKLEDELKKLIPLTEIEKQQRKFEIFIEYENLKDNLFGNERKKIEPYPILDLYDYRISGTIKSDGINKFEYHNQRNDVDDKESINFPLRNGTKCGDIVVDIRVYDRDKTAIDELIRRGLKNSEGGYLKSLEAKRLLDKYNGVGVYRNSFRIRPLGDPDYDWLELNKERVQKPARKLSTNQIIGFIHIQSEEASDLQETSARDGLKDNIAYQSLKEIIKQVISELETKRYVYRRSLSSGPTTSFQSKIKEAFDFEHEIEQIASILNRNGLSREKIQDVVKILEEKESSQKKVSDDIAKKIAVYQGQATVGKIVNVMMHEARRPLNFFKNEIPNFKDSWSNYKATREDVWMDTFLLPIGDLIPDNANHLVELFSKIEPLATGTRGNKKKENLFNLINNATQLLNQSLIAHNISCSIECDKTISLSCWRQDIQTIFANLIDNSIFWLKRSETNDRRIRITVEQLNNEITSIDYFDTGPGIASELLKDNVIFEPDFSTKPDGTGIGLSIAGEAAHRNNFELKAHAAVVGVHFSLSPNEKEI